MPLFTVVSSLAHLRRRGYDALAWLALALIFAGLFRHHLLGLGTFMGTSDRLNASIAMRLFHVHSLHQLGRIPAWSDAMFLGFPVDGLGYMPVLNDPLAYLLALFPAEHLVRVYGHVSIAVFLLTAWAAYLYLKEIFGSVLGAFVGSCVYALASYSLLKIGQQDPLNTAFVQMPLGLLLLRRSTTHRFGLVFVGFVLIVASLLLCTFVQETAYIVILFGAYALYRSLATRSVRPLLVCTLGGAFAFVLSLSRLVAFYQESQQLNRSTTFVVTDWSDVLRWLHEHIYTWNNHEGFHIFTSTFVAAIVVTTMLLPRLWARDLKSDVLFHLAFLILVFLVVLVEPVRYLMYLLFMRSDLLHSRFSMVGLIPLAAITAGFVNALLRSVPSTPRPSMHALLMTAAVVVAVAILWSIDRLAEGSLPTLLGLDELPRVGAQPAPINPGVALKALGALLVFALGAVAWVVLARRSRPGPSSGLADGSSATGAIPDAARHVLAYGLVALILAQMIELADFHLSGPLTWSFPHPYSDSRPFTAPATAFRTPSPAAVQSLRARLESDEYRAVAIHDPSGFPRGVEFASYLAQFWQLRLIQGYGTITSRFRSLPWPGNVANTRSLYFPAGSELPWDLLALLNVKYAIVVTPAVYYNLDGGDPTQAAEASPADVEISENPLPVAPRQFFARSVRPLGSPRETPLLPRDPTQESLVDGIARRVTYEAGGRLAVRYDGDRIDVSVDPEPQPRFLVLNEMYFPGWRAFADGRELQILPTNIVMRGLVVPPGVAEVQLRFVPPGVSDLFGLLAR